MWTRLEGGNDAVAAVMHLVVERLELVLHGVELQIEILTVLGESMVEVRLQLDLYRGHESSRILHAGIQRAGRGPDPRLQLLEKLREALCMSIARGNDATHLFTLCTCSRAAVFADELEQLALERRLKLAKEKQHGRVLVCRLIPRLDRRNSMVKSPESMGGPDSERKRDVLPALDEDRVEGR